MGLRLLRVRHGEFEERRRADGPVARSSFSSGRYPMLALRLSARWSLRIPCAVPERPEVERRQRDLDGSVRDVAVRKLEVEKIVSIDIDFGEREIRRAAEPPADDARPVG